MGKRCSDFERLARLISYETPDGGKLAGDIKRLFKQQYDREWRDGIEAVASRVARA